MPSQVYSCAHLLVDTIDVTGDLNALTLNYASETADDTVFGDTFRTAKGTMKTVAIDAGGFVNLGTSQSDEILYAKVGGTATLATVFPNGITNASTNAGSGYATKVVGATLQGGGQVGVLLPFTFNAAGAEVMVQAIPMSNALVTAWTTDSTGLGQTVCPISTEGWSTGEKLYAGGHLTALSTSKTTAFTALIQANSSSGFAPAATTLVTLFNGVTCKMSAWATPVASASLSTDRLWHRVKITVSTGAVGQTCGATAQGVVWMGLQ